MINLFTNERTYVAEPTSQGQGSRVLCELSPLTQPRRNAASKSRALSAKEWTEESKLGSSSAVAAPSRLLNGLV